MCHTIRMVEKSRRLDEKFSAPVLRSFYEWAENACSEDAFKKITDQMDPLLIAEFTLLFLGQPQFHLSQTNFLELSSKKQAKEMGRECYPVPGFFPR